MQVCKYYPVANDRMGTIWTLASIKDACVIEFGPTGTTHYAVEAVGSLNGEDNALVYSTHMDQNDITFGKYDRLEAAILEVDENIGPAYIFVMASSISSIIGADIESVCYDLKDKVGAMLIPITSGGLKDDYPKGVEKTLELLVNKIVKPGDQSLKKYNILGFTMDKYNYASDVLELKRIMSDLFDKEINTVFTCDTSIKEIKKASEASLNIVVRREAIKAAQLMKEKYGIPYVYKNLYGLNGMKSFVDAVSDVFGYELNEVAYDQEIAQVNQQMISMRRRFMFYKGIKKCAVLGDYDTVMGLSSLLEEFNLEVDRSEVLYKLDANESCLSGCSEMERMIYLKNKELLILLGDGPSLMMSHQAKLAFQVSNPNLDRVTVYPYTPFIGFRGILYLIEIILNMKL
ncbi:MAG: nitrogenase component 1 [Turicibacter sp.]